MMPQVFTISDLKFLKQTSNGRESRPACSRAERDSTTLPRMHFPVGLNPTAAVPTAAKQPRTG